MDEDEQGSGNGEGRVEWVDLYPVYDAMDEPAAIHVRAMLCSAGLDARIRSAQIPCFDGAFACAVGYWGQVLVPRPEVITAKAILEALEREGALGSEEDPGGC